MLWPHQDSNLDLKFRKLLFYPLNYGAMSLADGSAIGPRIIGLQEA